MASTKRILLDSWKLRCSLVLNNTIKRNSFLSSSYSHDHLIRMGARTNVVRYNNCNNSTICFASSSYRFFSNRSRTTESSSKSFDKNKRVNESLDETINEMKFEKEKSNKSDDESKIKSSHDTTIDDISYKIKDFFLDFKDDISDTWNELINSGQAKGINQRVKESTKKKTKDAYKGPSNLIIIDENENLGAWEKMQRRLAEAPIIQNILNDLIEKSGAKNLKRKIDDIKQDAEEVWETSQNPWVYRMSSVYDTFTAETEFAKATRILRKLDPSFSMEQFLHDAVERTLPDLNKNVLEGNIDDLEPLLGESVYQRLRAEMEVRKKEGLVLDTNILGIFNAEIIAAEVDKSNEFGVKEPILIIHYMCQQINCVRNVKGKVVEGKEDDIKANSYLVAFQREMDEDDSNMTWKIVDFRFNGAIAWI